MVKYICAVLNRVQLFETLWTVACQAPLSMDFSGKNIGVGCHFFLQGIFQTQGLNPSLLIRQVDSLPPGRPWVYIYKRGQLRPAHLSMAGRSRLTPEVRGRAWRTPCQTGGSQEELPHVRGHGQRPRVPDCDGAGTAKRSYPTSEVRGDGLEELPCVRGP